MSKSQLSENVRKLLWSLMTDQKLSSHAKDKGIRSLGEVVDLKLTDEEWKSVEGVNLDDLGDLLSSIENDLTVVMGGSRPRRAIALSDGAIKELQEALKNVKKLDNNL